MQLSIVTTLYNSAININEFHRRVSVVARQITDDYEIIFVDDGSPDESLSRALEIYRMDTRVRVIELSRNFGHHKAILTGLAYARGEHVFLIDSNLEEAPELLIGFFAELQTVGADVVYGFQKQPSGSILSRVGGWTYYRIFNFLSDYPLPANLLTVRLMRKKYVRALVSHREREVNLPGLWAITGFRQVGLPVVTLSRRETVRTVGRKLGSLVRAVTSFSDKPLTMIAQVGAGILLLSIVCLGLLIGRKFMFGLPVPGYTSLIVSIWLLGGLTVFTIGIVGIYLARVFIEVKRRPHTLLRSDYCHDASVRSRLGEGEECERSMQMVR